MPIFGRKKKQAAGGLSENGSNMRDDNTSNLSGVSGGARGGPVSLPRIESTGLESTTVPVPEQRRASSSQAIGNADAHQRRLSGANASSYSIDSKATAASASPRMTGSSQVPPPAGGLPSFSPLGLSSTGKEGPPLHTPAPPPVTYAVLSATEHQEMDPSKMKKDRRKSKKEEEANEAWKQKSKAGEKRGSRGEAVVAVVADKDSDTATDAPSTNRRTRRNSMNSNAMEGSMSMTEGAARPVSRKASTLSQTQQRALQKTPSSLSRRHTPPPSFMEKTVRKGKGGEKKSVNVLVLEDVPEMASTSTLDDASSRGDGTSAKAAPLSVPDVKVPSSSGPGSPGLKSAPKPVAPPAPPKNDRDSLGSAGISRTPVAIQTTALKPDAKLPKPVPTPDKPKPIDVQVDDKAPMLIGGGTLAARKTSLKETQMTQPEVSGEFSPNASVQSGGKAPKPVPAPGPTTDAKPAAAPASPISPGAGTAPKALPKPVQPPPTEPSTKGPRPAPVPAPPPPASPGAPVAATTSATAPKPVPAAAASASDNVSTNSRRRLSAYFEDDDDLFEMAPVVVPNGAAADAHNLTMKRPPAAGVSSSSDEDEEDDEDLLVGFRPDGFADKRGRRKVNHITFFISQMDSFYGSGLDDADVFYDGEGREIEAVKPQVSSSVRSHNERKPFFVPTYTASNCVGSPYTVTATGEAPHRPLRPLSSAASRQNASASNVFNSDPYGFGGRMDNSKSDVLGGSSSTAHDAFEVPKPLPSVFAGMSAKYKPDPAKIHTPLPNTFGFRRRRGSEDAGDDDYEYDDDEEFEDGEEGEWYWEEVEEEVEEVEEDEEDGGSPLQKGPQPPQKNRAKGPGAPARKTAKAA